MDLTDTETAMLAFEQSWWKYAGARDTAIHEQFAMTPVRYAQVLNVLIDRPEAEAADPMTVRRLRRLRAARRAQRSAARLGGL